MSLLALSGHFEHPPKCPLSGVKRTSQIHAVMPGRALLSATIRFGDSLQGPPLRLNLGRMKMATREARLAEFSQGTPKENRPLQILCEDKSGTYIIPYLCQWSDGAWRKVGSAKTIEATVIGWRTAPRSWR